MRKIRIGNDVRIRWQIEIDGEAQDISQYELHLIVTKPHGEKQSLPFTAQGNTIVAEYLGTRQECPGKYTLTLCAKKDGHQAIIDACNAFELVERSCEADECTHPVVDIEVVDINGNLVFGGIPEAPLDGRIYGRQDGKWTDVSRGSYTRIEKVCDYLHEIWYQGVDYGYADLLPHTPLGACTSIRKGKFFARNLDWQYSECCEFFVHTPAVDGRHAVDGFGGNIPALTKEVVESGARNAAYNWLPLSIADGHNDAGLCASMNVVPTKTAPNTYEKTTGTNPTKPTLNGLMIVRYILDNHTDALAAAEDIRDNWNVVMPHTDTFDEELHFLIADKTQTIVLEFVGNEAVIISKPDQDGYITNFRVYSQSIEEFGQGIERYISISEHITTPANINEAIGFVSQLWYTHAYNDDSAYNWRTEFAGLRDELTVTASFLTPEVYDSTIAAAHQAYLDRTRDGQTWQTTHSVVYDIETGECLFLVQQDESTTTRRDMALPIDAYTKAETDSLLEDKVDKVSGKGLSTNDYDNGEKSKLAGSLAYIAGESTVLQSGDTTMSIVYVKNDGEKGKVSLPLITPDNYGKNAYGIIRGEDFGKFNEKADKTFIAVYGVTPYNDVKAAHEAGTTIICQHYGIYEPLVSAAANTFTFCTLLNKMRFMSYLSANGWAEIAAETLATSSDLAAKQDTISDLSDIRSGASAGATAVQPDDLPTFGNIVTHDADEFLPSSTDYIKDAAVSQDGNTLTLTKKNDTQVTFAPSGGGGGGADPEAVHFTPQTLTEAQKSQARSNIGASGIPEELFGLMCTSETLYKGKLTSGKYFAKKTKPAVADIAEVYSIPSLLTTVAGLFNSASNLTIVHSCSWDMSALTNLKSAFQNCANLISVDTRHWDISSVTELGSLFFSCSLLQNIDVGYWDTSSVIGMSSMFSGCHSLANIDVSNWVVDSVTTMENMFSGCTILESIDVSSWNVSSVESMKNMFQSCVGLSMISTGGWNVSSVTNTSGMFFGCDSLVSLDVSNWDVSSVTTMSSMFYNCSKLVSLDVSNWDVSSVDAAMSMFLNCKSLTTIIGNHTIQEVLDGLGALNGTKVNLQLSYCTLLERASLRAVINGLADLTGQTSQTLTLGNTLKAKLTAEDIQIATDKNWVIA